MIVTVHEAAPPSDNKPVQPGSLTSISWSAGPFDAPTLYAALAFRRTSCPLALPAKVSGTTSVPVTVIVQSLGDAPPPGSTFVTTVSRGFTSFLMMVHVWVEPGAGNPPVALLHPADLLVAYPGRPPVTPTE